MKWAWLTFWNYIIQAWLTFWDCIIQAWLTFRCNIWQISASSSIFWRLYFTKPASSSGSASPTEAADEMCSFLVIKHSWKGKYKRFVTDDGGDDAVMMETSFKLPGKKYWLKPALLLTGGSASAPCRSPPTTRALWRRPTSGSTATSSPSFPQLVDRQVFAFSFHLFISVL